MKRSNSHKVKRELDRWSKAHTVSSDPVVRARWRRLAAAGLVTNALCREVGVSYSMALKWMNNQRNSARLERAFERLTQKEARS